jgi:hypothetical protein
VDETATISDWRRTNQVREVTAQEGAALARKMSSDLGMPVPFLETSAKLNRNVTTALGGMPLPFFFFFFLPSATCEHSTS